MKRNYINRLKIVVFALLLNSTVYAQSWDNRPESSYDAEYTQKFNQNVGWDRFKFYGQWDALQSDIFNASDISTGALQFQWIKKRVICSKDKYTTPYVLEADLDYTGGTNRAGVVIRIQSLSESIQEPDSDPGFNREGIALYPTSNGSSMIVQFSGEDKGAGGGTNFTRILVPKPAGVSSLLNRGTLRIEDFGTSIYIFYNGTPFIRIELDDKIHGKYSAGVVYDANMQSKGRFTGMEIEESGHVAIAERDASLRLFSVTVKYNNNKVVFNPADTVIFESPFRDLYADTWVATDDLGRQLPDYNEAGFIKNDKRRVVGIFYVTWHLQSHYSNFSSPFSADVTRILEANSNARFDAHHTLWNFGTYSYHWGEPEMGYFLSQDEYVIRKDMAMLANAGVDVLIMDVTNAVRYWDEWEVLFSIMQKIKAEGNQVPKFCFWAFNGPVISVVQDLYDYYYKVERYKDLWFYWDDKPLLLYNKKPSVDANGGGVLNPNPNYNPDAINNPNNPHYGDSSYTQEYLTDYTREVKDFFSTRNMWWGYYNWAGERYVGTEDNWSFGYDLSNADVKAMNPNQLIATHNGIKEQAAVCPAQHPSSLVGKSWSRANGEPLLDEYDMPKATYVPWLDKTVENPEAYGIYFQERWNEALSSDPEFIYINDWNEWTAGKFHDGKVNPFMRRNSPYYFVDQYNAEFNRCIQPMKDGYSDNYYMQMVQNIRKYKGVRRHTVQAEISNISIDNEYGDWEQVPFEFRDAIGDTRYRDHNGYGGLHYTNTTGRNDIMCSKVAYDKDSLYFYVKTVRNLTSHDDSNWMLLLIDADRNKETGWEGYDYIINKGVISSTQTTLKKWTGASWENQNTVSFAYSDSEMEIGISRTEINITEETPHFYFKWADNPQILDDISAFFTDGEAAPDRRFIYSFNPLSQNTAITENKLISNFVEIYPNPSESIVYIKTSGASNIDIFNMSSQIVYSKENLSEKTKINVSDWLPGVYVVKINCETKIFTHKLIIK